MTKPGVLLGNVITVPAGFLLASQGSVNWPLFVAVFSGTTLIIASACVLNNYLDQDIDSQMDRTKQRPLVAGDISGRSALLFSDLLGLVGLGILLLYTNILVAVIGVIGFIDYVWLYGAWSKRKSYHGTVVGSISGATPILAGYVAVSNTIDIGAILVFMVLFFWQMPEFYSIAIYRLKEYKMAQIPVISVVKGIDYTKKQIFGYTILFVAASLLLYVFSYTGVVYAISMGVAGLYWLWLAAKGLGVEDSAAWARKMFRFALIMLLLFCLLISIDGYYHKLDDVTLSFLI